jgi:hypothetical protein
MQLKVEESTLFKILFEYFNIPRTNGFGLYSKEALLPEEINLLEILSFLKLMVCGGTVLSIITNQHVNDLDFYMKDASRKQEIESYFEKVFGKPVFVSGNAVTYQRKGKKKSYTVQLISRFSGDAFNIFDTFDFTITQGAYDFNDKLFYFGDRFFQDVSKRRLVYSGSSKYPICALYRTKKYQERGYYLPGSTAMHIALSIVQLKIKNYGELKEQLMGVDTMYLQNLLSFKDENSQNPVDYGKFLEEAFMYLNGHGEEDE